MSFFSSVGGGLIQSGFDAIIKSNQMDKANSFANRQAGKARDFEAMMSNTAHQREVQDLIAAGLNPTLSAGGGGASTPSSPMASPTVLPIEGPDIMSAMSLDLENRKVKVQEELAAAEITNKLDTHQINQLKKTLMQKGMPRAELEGAFHKWINKALEFMNGKGSRRRSPGLGDLQGAPSSGGSRLDEAVQGTPSFDEQQQIMNQRF